MYEELLSFAHTLADRARPLALQYFRRPHQSEWKPDHTPVTAADKAIEAALRQAIERDWPQHGVHGEEFGAEGLDREFVWVLDPIDGTRSFATGSPLFGTLIGLLHRGRPVLGVLDAPALGERWAAALGGPTRWQGDEVRVRPAPALAEAWLLCTTSEVLVGDPGWQRLRAAVGTCCHGGDCCAYGFLANGHADLIVDRGLKLHDWCALVPIVQQAGGAMLDWHGRPLQLGSDGDVVAAGSEALALRAGEELRRR